MALDRRQKVDSHNEGLCLSEPYATNCRVLLARDVAKTLHELGRCASILCGAIASSPILGH